MTHQDIAVYALEALRKAGAAKAACRVTRGRKEELNVEAGDFSLLRTLFSDEMSLKAIVEGRKGTATVNKLDKDSIDQAVADCVALAASGTADQAEDIAEKIQNKSFDQRVGGADMPALFGRTKDFVQQVADEFPKVVLGGVTSEFNAARTLYVNSKGVEFDADEEYYQMSTFYSAKDGQKATSFNGYGARLSSLDKAFIDLDMHRAMLEESVRSLDARALEGKFVGKMVVTPACDDMIWQTLLDCFLGDGALVSGTSRWKDSLGAKVADSKLTMRAAPLHPAIVAGERFTADGFESRDMDIIRDGALASFALSLYGARKTGKPRALNTAFDSIEVAAGSTPLEQMIKGIDRGILVNRFSGARPGPSGDVSGVAKNSFLIENGQIAGALEETMISFNIADALANIPAISQERCANGVTLLPWCCFDGVTISGK